MVHLLVTHPVGVTGLLIESSSRRDNQSSVLYFLYLTAYLVASFPVPWATMFAYNFSFLVT